MSIFSRKTVESVLLKNKNNVHKKTLTAFELIVIGVGIMVGSGIFTLTCLVAANFSGPAIMISYLIAGVISLFVAFLYAEMSSKLPCLGSVYDYSYIAFGQLFAWFIFTCSIIELVCGLSYTTSALSAYLITLINAAGVDLPEWYLNSTVTQGLLHLPSAFIVFPLAISLIFGTIGGKYVRRFLFFIKMAAIFILIISLVKYCKLDHLSPFVPFGWQGVLIASSPLLLCFYGVGPMTVLVRECKKPKTDITIGTIGSVLITCIIYMMVSSIIVSLMPYHNLNRVTALFDVLDLYKSFIGKCFVYIAGIAGMIFIVLFFLETVVRMVFAAIEDHLLPKFLKSRILIIFVTSFLGCFLIKQLPIFTLAQVNSLAICANYFFIAVLVVFFRIYKPNLQGEFKCPLVILIVPVTVFFTAYLFVRQFLECAAVGKTICAFFLVSFGYYFALLLFRWSKNTLRGNR